MSALITDDLVVLDLPDGLDRAGATAVLADRLVAAGRVADRETFLADVATREGQMPTGLEGGIGIPHARSAAVVEPTVAFGRSAAGIDFGAEDGPADLVFLIAAPDGAGADHMTILAGLARKLVHADFKDGLRAATDAATVTSLINEGVSV